jgi:hypothetical protein
MPPCEIRITHDVTSDFFTRGPRISALVTRKRSGYERQAAGGLFRLHQILEFLAEFLRRFLDDLRQIGDHLLIVEIALL